jgi:aspartate racemase
MVAETACAFRTVSPASRTVGLLATSGTVRSGIYQRTFERHDVDVLTPGDEEQRRVHEGISQVKAGAHDRETAATFESIGDALVARGAEAVILGCTEIPLAFDDARVRYRCLNATRILAQAAVDWLAGRRG